MKWKFALFAVFSLLLFSYTSDAKAQTFSDVPPSKSYYDAVEWAVEKGLINGYADGTFKPNNVLTEAQFVKMYVNVLPFEGDRTLAPYNENHYKIAQKYGVPVSKSIDFRNLPIWRGNVARMLVFAAGDSNYDDYDYASNYLMKRGISKGQNPSATTPRDIFGYDNDLRRYHAVVFLYEMYGKTDNPYLGVAVGDNGYITLTPYQELEYVAGFEPEIIPIGPSAWHKRIAIQGTYSYEMTGSSYKDMTVTFYNGQQPIGGIETTEGKQVGHFTIGGSTNENNDEVNGTYYRTLTDPENNNKILAVYWGQSYHIPFTTEDMGRNEQFDVIAVEVLNSIRYRYGLNPLILDRKVSNVNYMHSLDMETKNYFDHYTLDGKDHIDRLTEANIHNVNPGEVIAIGLQNPLSVIDQYFHSPPHRSILLMDFTHIGSGSLLRANGGVVHEVTNTMNPYTIKNLAIDVTPTYD